MQSSYHTRWYCITQHDTLLSHWRTVSTSKDRHDLAVAEDTALGQSAEETDERAEPEGDEKLEEELQEADEPDQKHDENSQQESRARVDAVAESANPGRHRDQPPFST